MPFPPKHSAVLFQITTRNITLSSSGKKKEFKKVDACSETPNGKKNIYKSASLFSIHWGFHGHSKGFNR